MAGKECHYYWIPRSTCCIIIMYYWNWIFFRVLWKRISSLQTCGTTCVGGYEINSLCPSDAIWRHRSVWQHQPEPMLTTHQWGFTCIHLGQFHRKCPRYIFLIWVWNSLIEDYNHITQGPMSYRLTKFMIHIFWMNQLTLNYNAISLSLQSQNGSCCWFASVHWWASYHPGMRCTKWIESQSCHSVWMSPRIWIWR